MGKTGEFRDPAGLVLDQLGNIIVADSRNHRLQVFNARGKYQGFVRVDPPVRRPSGIYLDCDEGELYVLNYWGNSMAKYSLLQDQCLKVCNWGSTNNYNI